MEVIVISNDICDLEYPESELQGQLFIKDVLGKSGTWLQTSYNHNFRHQYAGVGFCYDPNQDVFIEPMPGCGHEELVLNNLFKWECSNAQHFIEL